VDVISEGTYDLVSRPARDDRPVPAAAAVFAVDRPGLSTKSVSDCGVTDIAALYRTTHT